MNWYRSGLAFVVGVLTWLAPIVLRQLDATAPVYNMPVGSTLLDVPGIGLAFLMTLGLGAALTVSVTGWVEPGTARWTQRRVSLGVAPLTYALTHTLPFAAQFVPLFFDRPELRPLLAHALGTGLCTELLFVSLAALGGGLGLALLDGVRGLVRGKLALRLAARKA